MTSEQRALLRSFSWYLIGLQWKSCFPLWKLLHIPETTCPALTLFRYLCLSSPLPLLNANFPARTHSPDSHFSPQMATAQKQINNLATDAIATKKQIDEISSGANQECIARGRDWNILLQQCTAPIGRNRLTFKGGFSDQRPRGTFDISRSLGLPAYRRLCMAGFGMRVADRTWPNLTYRACLTGTNTQGFEPNCLSRVFWNTFALLHCRGCMSS